jgi:hypothetical protein
MKLSTISAFLKIIQTDKFVVTEPPYSKNDATTDKLWQASVQTENRNFTRTFDVGAIEFLTSLTSSLLATIYSPNETCQMFLDDDLEDLILTNYGADKLRVEYKGQLVCEGLQTKDAIFDCLKALAAEMRSAIDEERTVPSYLGGPQLSVGWGRAIIDIGPDGKFAHKPIV